jgi:hypothetical protein
VQAIPPNPYEKSFDESVCDSLDETKKVVVTGKN